MLRYFYILCLSFAIKHCFCYSYIDSDVEMYTTSQRPYRKNRKYHQKNRFDENHYSMKNRPEYEVVNAKDPIAQIDVASFIRKPDEYAIEDNSLYETETKKRLNKIKPYKDYPFVPKNYLDNELKIDEKLYPSNYPKTAVDDKLSKLNARPPLMEDSINSLYQKKKTPGYRWEQKKSARNSEPKSFINNWSYQNELSDIRDAPTHNPEKKSSRKNFKIPFFSHSKSPQKQKKNNKRKIFCFHCTNKEQETTSEAQDNLKANGRKDSEQIIQKLNDEIQNPVIMKREKREDWTTDKDRQLKEIDEIQRKIDLVKIIPKTPVQ